ncbi:hypothetical protein AB0B13_04950 [Streptomyces sp. NPDC042898]|uniref:hypothetical protein n=1 Tax=Streptomyces sp. NPDC042898 TaxID=3154334 RepID=UPI0033F3803C
MTRALDLRETADALERYRRRAVELMGIAAVAVVLAVGAGMLPWAWTSDAVGWLGGLAVAALVFGIGAWAIGKRMRHTLGAGTWSAHAAVPVARAWGSATVVLAAPGSGEVWPLKVVAVRQRYELVRPGPDGVLWWCGDPNLGGVIAPPGGGELIWAKPVRGRAARRRIVARAEQEGLLSRPVPRSPQPAPEHVAPRPKPTRRRRGVWRWVALVAAVALGLAVYGAEQSLDDPQVDLTILSRQDGNACTVSWKDPFDGTARTGPYQCHPEQQHLGDWDTGFVVSYGPWKGDLYNAEWEGTPVDQVTDWLGGLGALGLLVGLVGGGVSRWRRRAVAPVPYADPYADPDAAARVRLDKARTGPVPTYARLAAHAGRQAVAQTGTRRRPEADVRAVPWWRVRGLRRVSALEELLVAAVGCAGAGLGVWLDVGIPAYVIGVLMAGTLLRACFRLLTTGRPVALLLARAATAPVPVVRRYALLYDPRGGTPVLVVFPAHGGPDDRPEGLIPLAPPGTSNRPRLGLPSAPTGSVELRGWLDRADNGLPIVVPWIEGRPLWPVEPYAEAGGSDFAEHLEWLAPPEEDQEEEASAS